MLAAAGAHNLGRDISCTFDTIKMNSREHMELLVAWSFYYSKDLIKLQSIIDAI